MATTRRVEKLCRREFDRLRRESAWWDRPDAEIRVQRVGAPALDRAARRHQGLCGNLAPEGALALLFGIGASKDVVVNRLNIQQTNEEFQGIGHGPLLHSSLRSFVTSK
jgi:hypothetical protein